MSARSTVIGGVNRAIGVAGVRLVRASTADPGVEGFLSARQTQAAARAAHLSVTDYIDREFAQPGATVATVDRILELAQPAATDPRIVEIGPGSGRFAELLVDRLHPAAYDVYETATDWLPHLRAMSGVTVLPCDGWTLGATPDASVWLAHAQKVFVYVPFATSMVYLAEMARVVRPGGFVAFDVISEDCLLEATVQAWAAQRTTIYRPIPRGPLLEHLATLDLHLVGSFFTPLHEGRTEELVLRRGGD